MKRALVLVGVVLVTIVAGACAKLLGLKDDDAPGAFPHKVHAGEGISCVQCHAGITRAGETGALHIPSAESCVGCHEQPHNPNPCMQCHGRPQTLRRAAEARHYIKFRHDEHVKELHGNCVRCHLGVAGEDESARAPMAACLGCHEHKDEFRIGQCEGCHIDIREEMAFPETHLVHDADFLRRHGVQAASAGDLCASCHTETFCAQCHGVTVAVLPSRFRFEDTMRRTMHRANFFARHAEESRGQPGLCSTCHAEEFCADCHLDKNVHAAVVGARNPHPPGWVGALGQSNQHGRAARRDPASCASCHGGPGEMLCVQCHRVGGIGGSPHPPGWSSRKDLSEVPCRLCHMPGSMP